MRFRDGKPAALFACLQCAEGPRHPRDMARILTWQRQANGPAGAPHTALQLLALDALQEVVYPTVTQGQASVSGRQPNRPELFNLCSMCALRALVTHRGLAARRRQP